MIFLIATALVILLSVRYLQIEDENHGEYYALLLFATVGMMFMASGYDLIVQFLGLETMAISFYVLTGFLRHDKRSNEGAVKYLLLGAFSSGDCWRTAFRCSTASAPWPDLSGPCGLPLQVPRTNLDVMRAALDAARARRTCWCFWRSSRWPRDCSSRSPPCPSTSGRRTCTKARPRRSRPTSAWRRRRPASRCCCACCSTRFWPVRVDWVDAHRRAWPSLRSRIGNFAAITQTNVKRMLAYSSISHVGYILLGMVAALERPDGNRDRHEGHRVLPVRLRLHDHRRVRRADRAAAAGNHRR